MHHDILPGFEATDDHVAAFAVYTSGTTGRPKGVLHEVGNLVRMSPSAHFYEGGRFPTFERCASLALLNFVASITVIMVCLCEKDVRNYIVSYDTIKNYGSLAKFFLVNRIHCTFLTPSYARKLGGNTGPFLCLILLSSEPANNTFIKKVDMVNLYASSESGFVITSFKLDKPYENCPIGKPLLDVNLCLLDEDGNEVPDGEIGELCFDNRYFRGYINLPEETARKGTTHRLKAGGFHGLKPKPSTESRLFPAKAVVKH